MPANPCLPNCHCGKHSRTPEHNHRIGMAVALTAEAKGLKATPQVISSRTYNRTKRKR